MRTLNLISLKDHQTNAGFDMAPYGLAVLSALTPQSYRVNVYDIHENEEHLEDADLTGISVMTPVANKAYRLADRLRSRGKKVILGGIHVSMMPQEAAQHADSVVIGEVESVWSDILKDFEKGELQDFYRCDRPSLDALPLLRREHFKDTKSRTQVLQTTRGCPFGCDFCSVTSYNGRKFRHMPVAQVIRQLKEMKSKWFNLFSFIDDNIVADPEYAKRLFRAMIPLKIGWVGQASLTVAKDEELLRLARKSGCQVLVIGFESIRQDALESVNKGYKVSEYADLIRKIKDNNILVFGTFMFGFDGDRTEDFKRTTDFCISHDLDIVSFHPLTPFPGTELFSRLEREGRLKTKDWDQYNWRNVVFTPDNMSEKELAEGIYESFRRFYAWPRLLKKLLSMVFHGKISHTLMLIVYYVSTRYHLRGVYATLKAQDIEHK